MAATNINRVVLTGNLTRDPELRSLAERHVGLLAARRVQHPAQEQRHRRLGGQAQLLRRHRLGRAGRELRPLPRQGPPRRHRRPARVARVGGQEGNKRQAIEIIADAVQFLGGRDDGQGGGGGSRHAPTSRSTRATSSRRRAGRRGRGAPRPTTTSRSEPLRRSVTSSRAARRERAPSRRRRGGIAVALATGLGAGRCPAAGDTAGRGRVPPRAGGGLLPRRRDPAHAVAWRAGAPSCDRRFPAMRADFHGAAMPPAARCASGFAALTPGTSLPRLPPQSAASGDFASPAQGEPRLRAVRPRPAVSGYAGPSRPGCTSARPARHRGPAGRITGACRPATGCDGELPRPPHRPSHPPAPRRGAGSPPPRPRYYADLLPLTPRSARTGA